MADEYEIFEDAGRKLFGEGFTKKAKERYDDELKLLAAQQVGDPAQSANLSHFFSPAVKPQPGNIAKASKKTEGSHLLDPTTTLRRRRRTTHGGDGINHHARR